ncbi:MAG: hypothetical protein RR704_02980 [Stenotrophomonas sp.]
MTTRSILPVRQRRRFPALLAILAVGLPLTTAHAESPAPVSAARTAPGPHCMDAKGLLEMNQSSPDSITLLDRHQSPWRLRFNAACPRLLAAEDPRIAAVDSWVCGTGDERVMAGDTTCTVAAVERISRREFAQQAKQNDVARPVTLDAVNVTEHRRTFRGSPSYCFSTRHVRGWSDSAQGVTVETNPRYSGGYRHYVIEVAPSCRGLVHSPQLRFHSGFKTGVICGHPGDMLEVIPTVDPILDAIAERGYLPEPPINRTQARCEILAVYPAAS